MSIFNIKFFSSFFIVAGILTGLLLNPYHSTVFAMGNHPESGICSLEKPYQAICTHSLHSLEGWSGPCYDNEQQAQQDADDHANTRHNGNSRYTGIKKARVDTPPGY